MQELESIRSAQAGDPSAWEALVQTHLEPVFRFAYLLLGDPAEADDVAQETFLRAYRALARFDPDRPLRPWLLAITANLARNRLRSLGRYAAAVRRWTGAQSVGYPSPVEAGAAGRIEAERLRQAVSRLRQEDQRVIYLRYFLDLPVDETAEALGVAQGTVKSRTARALDRLRGVIEKEFPELTAP